MFVVSQVGLQYSFSSVVLLNEYIMNENKKFSLQKNKDNFESKPHKY